VSGYAGGFLVWLFARLLDLLAALRAFQYFTESNLSSLSARHR